MRSLGCAAACALLSGCLYVEAGGGVYGGSKGATAGWQVAGGLYLELDAARLSTGGGGSILKKDGTQYAGAGIHTKVDVTIQGEKTEPLIRGTLAGSFGTGDDDPTDDRKSGWAVFGGATLGLNVGEEAQAAIGHTLALWASGGVDLVRAGDATFVGPAVRAGIGGNFTQLFGFVN